VQDAAAVGPTVEY